MAEAPMLAPPRTGRRVAGRVTRGERERRAWMQRGIVQTDEAPAAIGAYSQAVKAGDLLFCSGQIPLDPASGELVEGPAPEQARRCLDNLDAVCRASGTR